MCMGLGATFAATYVRGRDKASEKLKLLPFVKVADARRRRRPCQAGIGVLTRPPMAGKQRESEEKKTKTTSTKRTVLRAGEGCKTASDNNMGNGKWQREPLEHFVLPTFRRARKTQVRFGDATPRVFSHCCCCCCWAWVADVAKWFYRSGKEWQGEGVMWEEGEAVGAGLRRC